MSSAIFALPSALFVVWSVARQIDRRPPEPAPTPRAAAVHVLQRLSFGPRPGDVERVMATGVSRWIDQQLDPASIDDRTLEAALRRYRYLDRDPGELRELFPRPAQLLRAAGGTLTPADSTALRESARNARVITTELLSARVARAVATERQLNEVLVDFWLNHFSVFLGKNAVMRYHLPQFEREAIRPHVLGRFRDLLGAVAHSPAMLIYLDNVQSVADSARPTLAGRTTGERRMALARRMAARRRGDNRIDTAQFDQLLRRRPTGLNENYARELLELHTLGVDGGYTQRDVIEVARALTGWTVRPGGGRHGDGFVFNPVTHDAGEKLILGQRFPGGRGEAEGEAVLDLLAHHPSTARHIARKLAIRFVSDDPPPALVDRAAEVFQRTRGDLRAVVRTIVTSPEFQAPDVYRAKVKSPFEVVVSAIRALGGVADSTAMSAALVARLGQPLYGHQAPDGWPETGAEWMNTGAILGRINAGLTLSGRGVPGTAVSRWPMYPQLKDASRPVQVEGVIEGLLGGEVSPETRRILESGDNPMLGEPRRLPGLEQMIGLALGAPEFQRR